MKANFRKVMHGPTAPVLLIAGWTLLMTRFTVNGHAARSMNADSMLNSIMSLQNVTIYYWGQNRLLNVLPSLAVPFRDPSANLAAVIHLTAAAYFAFLLAISAVSARAFPTQSQPWLTFATYVALSAFSALLLSPHAVGEIAILHIEYALPAAFVALAVYLGPMERNHSPAKILTAASALVIATGTNPSVLLPCIFISISSIILLKRLDRGFLAFGIGSIAAFAGWTTLEKYYGFCYDGSTGYTSFDPAQLPRGLGATLPQILGAIDPLVLSAPLWIWVIYAILTRKHGTESRTAEAGPVGRLSALAVAFGASWIVLFSGSQWVEINGFAWRYFIFAIFSFITATALIFAGLLVRVPRLSAVLLTAVAAATAFGATHARPEPLSDLSAFQNVSHIAAPGTPYVAGDYWMVWPIVMRELMDGNPTFGLAHRGQGNGDELRSRLRADIEADGIVEILCVNETEANCVTSVQRVAPGLTYLGPDQEGDRAFVMRFSGWPQEAEGERGARKLFPILAPLCI